MIRAIRPNAVAQDDANMIVGWNIAPNVAYTVILLPGASACGVLIYDEDGSILIASGSALVGTDQPCVLSPQSGQTIGMVDVALGWHLLLTTVGTESQRTIRIGPMVDLPDEIHPVYGDDDMAASRATAAIDDGAHYIDDVTVSCPLGLGASLGDVVSVPVEGEQVIGQVESISWVGGPDGGIETAVIRRHVAIAPESFVEPTPPTPPTLVADTAATDADTATAGNVLNNDAAGLTVVAVNGLSASVGSAVAGSAGGLFTVNSDGSWAFDPNEDFGSIEENTETAVTYYASNGESESSTTLTVTVSPSATVDSWTPAEIADLIWLDPSDDTARTVINSGVEGLTDKIGGVSTIAAPASTRRPTLAEDQLNNLDMMYMPGSDICMIGLAGQITGDCTLVCVCIPDESQNAIGGILAYQNTSGAPGVGQARSIVLRNTGQLYYAWGSSADYNPAGASWVGGAPNIVATRYDVDDVTMSVNGAAFGPETVSALTTAPETYALEVGRRYAASAWDYFKGYVGDIIVIPASVSDADFRRIEGFLAHKWGLADNLPVGHPYKLAAPTMNWTPADTTTTLWLDAADESTVTTSDGVVSERADKSGNSMNASQSTASKRPVANTSTDAFDGIDDTLIVANNAALYAPKYIVAVAKADVIEGYERLLNFWGASVGWFVDFGSTAGLPRLCSNSTILTAPTSINNTLATIEAQIDGASSFIGTPAGVTDGTLPTPSNFAYSLLIAWNGGSGSPAPVYTDLDFHELVILPSSPTADTREKIQGYLAHKWDALLGVTTLVDALPSDHTYKSAPPTI